MSLPVPPVNKWVEPCDRMLYQTYYRAWGMVEVPKAPIEDVVAACKQLASTTRKGNVYWIFPGRLAKWDGAEVFPDIFESVWIFYRPVVGHTFLARQGFWKMYMISSLLKRPA